MHYFIFPDIDTTIYQASASLNTGLDEILEVRKDLTDSNTNPKVSRILMKFDLSYISQSVSNGTIGSNAKYYLNLYDAKPSELTTSQSVKVGSRVKVFLLIIQQLLMVLVGIIRMMLRQRLCGMVL